jgi:hypothetical protein
MAKATRLTTIATAPPAAPSSRRGFLLNTAVSVASLASASAMASPSAPAPVDVADPIYAAIERHRAAVLAFEKAVHDKPENEKSRTMDEAAVAVLNTRPETLEGAGAVLRYMVEHMDHYNGEAMGFPDNLFSDGVGPDAAKRNDSRSSEYFLMRNVANALERLSATA